MKVVVDTNVLVSGLRFGGVPGQILTAWTTGAFVLVVTPSILSNDALVALLQPGASRVTAGEDH